jgi:hypothetical protein
MCAVQALSVQLQRISSRAATPSKPSGQPTLGPAMTGHEFGAVA